jgi:hypothetical protein
MMKDPDEIVKFCQFLDTMIMRLKSNVSMYNFNNTVLESINSTTTNNNNNSLNLNLHDYEILAAECYNFKHVNIDMRTMMMSSISMTSASPMTSFNYSTMAGAVLAIKKSTYNVTMSNEIRLGLIKYFYPIILLVGLFGNLVSFVAMLRKNSVECKYIVTTYTDSSSNSRNKNHYCKQPPHTFSFCLAMLCMADFFILVFGCLHEYVETTFGFSLRSTFVITCKTVYFSCYLFSSYVSYLHAYIATDRWFAIVKPLEYKNLQVMRNNKVELLFMFGFCLVICLPFFYFPTLIDSTGNSTMASISLNE